MISAKAPNEVDKVIGLRIRRLRLAVGMSQEGLGERLGLTFQQVQKYEKGVNRVGASRLLKIAGIFGVSISDLFPDTSEVQIADFNNLDTLLANPEILELARAFQQIENPTLRRALIQLAKASGPQD